MKKKGKAGTAVVEAFCLGAVAYSALGLTMKSAAGTERYIESLRDGWLPLHWTVHAAVLVITLVLLRRLYVSTRGADTAEGVSVEGPNFDGASVEDLLGELAKRGTAVLLSAPIAALAAQNGLPESDVREHLPRIREAVSHSTAKESAEEVVWHVLSTVD